MSLEHGSFLSALYLPLGFTWMSYIKAEIRVPFCTGAGVGCIGVSCHFSGRQGEGFPVLLGKAEAYCDQEVLLCRSWSLVSCVLMSSGKGPEHQCE